MTDHALGEPVGLFRVLIYCRKIDLYRLNTFLRGHLIDMVKMNCQSPAKLLLQAVKFQFLIFWGSINRREQEILFSDIEFFSPKILLSIILAFGDHFLGENTYNCIKIM